MFSTGNVIIMAQFVLYSIRICFTCKNVINVYSSVKIRSGNLHLYYIFIILYSYSHFLLLLFGIIIYVLIYYYFNNLTLHFRF